MKIVHLTRLFYPHLGGVEKHVLELSKIEVKEGHEVVVVTEKWDKKLKEKEKIHGIQIIRIKTDGNRISKKLSIWFSILKNITTLTTADVVHCHDVFFWYLPFRFALPFKKVFVTFHGYEGNKIPGKRAILMHKIAEHLSFGNICVGKFLEKWYGTKASIITYGAIKKHKMPQKFASITRIVFIGRLEEETGLMQYLHAIKVLMDRNIMIQLTVLGDGKKMNEARKYSLKNRLKVKFLGFVTDVEKHIESSTVIFTSRYLGILESLSYGKIVIALYNNSIKHDYLNMTPFKKYIFITNSSEEISDFIIGLQANSQDEMSLDGYKWASKQTWKKLANQYMRLWTNDLVS